MNCTEARRLLRERFDNGQPLDEGLGAHLAGCVPCRAYRMRLAALADALAGLPLESPTAGFRERVELALARSAHAEAQQRRLAIGLALGAVAAIGAVGWFYPAPLDLAQWVSAGARQLAAFETPGWRAIGQSSWALVHSAVDGLGAVLVEQGAAVWRQVEASLSWREGMTPLIYWSTLAASVFALVAVNSAELWRLRSTTAPQGRKRTTAKR